MESIDIQLLLNQGQTWISEYVLVTSNFVQLTIVALTWSLAWIVAKPLRRQHKQWVEKQGKRLVPGTLRNVTNVLILPTLWLFFLWLLTSVARQVEWHDSGLIISTCPCGWLSLLLR